MILTYIWVILTYIWVIYTNMIHWFTHLKEIRVGSQIKWVISSIIPDQLPLDLTDSLI
jgi:hypothetical protein